MGNFGWVIEDVYKKAYEPMIGALERHPSIRLALHYTGPLLEWMDAQRPDSIERLRALADRGQVEILGGGLYEPILVALPVRDRIGQLSRMREDIERRFGRAPIGAWLAERVWEPSLPFDLASAGYEYTVLDDNHFRGAFLAEKDMWGSYTTDDQGLRLTVFGTDKGLRDSTPWKPADHLIEYMRSNATEDGQRVGIMGDDGEKFGAWPGTHELCWSKEEWVERCFTALEENSAWLTTVTPSAWMADHDPLGRVYIPASSYVEMTEWALPAEEQPLFHKAREEAEHRHSIQGRFLRGALWRNFQARYREVNELHKQMVRVSAAVDAMRPGPLRERALDHLYRGQSNDCYWHGWFGGIYIVHMRMATLAELIAAEDLALGDRALTGVGDYDLDGVDEIAIGTVGQTVIVDIAEGAGISSWDLRASHLALASVLRRRPEPYHRQILDEAAKRTSDDQASSDLSGLIVYDDHERRNALVRVLDSVGGAVDAFDTAPWLTTEVSDSKLVAERHAHGLRLRKAITVGGDRNSGFLTVTVSVHAEANIEGSLELEWNINLLGGGGNPAAYYRSGDDEWRHDSTGAVAATADLAFGNSYEGAQVGLTASPPAPAEWFAVQTVSNSETGFEKVYQGSCLTQRWELALAAGESVTIMSVLSFVQSRDRAAEGESA